MGEMKFLDTNTPPKVQGTQYSDLALHTIGWKAFQDLCINVCETVLGYPVSVYRESNDGGQDATFLIPSQTSQADFGGTVQCKHTSTSGRRMMVSDLTPEIEKIKRLVERSQADTYIFISNMSLDAPVAVAMRQKLQDIGVKNPQIWGKEKLINAIRTSARLRALVPQVYGLGDLSIIIDERAVEQTRALLGHWLPKLKSYVSTSSHDKAVRALEKNGVVLLLGNPSTGKSTIGAILSTIASEDLSHTVLQLSSPKDFETHWNPNDRRRFFWLDDAFGSNVLREDFVLDWSALFAKVQTSIEQGNKFLFTSRRHIYNAAVPKLGNRNLEAFRTKEAIVDMATLTTEEKAQILYNHINFGSQSKFWKTRAKPYLDAVSKTKFFLPGIAERLGNPAFTRNVSFNEEALVKFMSAPQEHLIETIEELEPSMRAALILVFANQGSVSVNSPNNEILSTVASATGAQVSHIWDALPALNNSFLRQTRSLEGEVVWEFEHPTISDALTKILDGQPQMLSAMLRGASIDKVLSDFVCRDMAKIPDAVVVPYDLTGVLVERLLSVPDEPLPNSLLFRFLAERADNEVFRRVVTSAPSVLARSMWFSGDAWLNPKYRAHARAASLGILPDVCRDETIRLLEWGAIENFDLSFVQRDDLLSLFSPKKIFEFGIKIRDFMENKLEKLISNTGDEADIDGDPESNFETIRDSLEIIEELDIFDRDDVLCTSAREAIAREVGYIESEQEKKRQEEQVEEDEREWTFATSRSSSNTNSSWDDKNLNSDRSIFDDIDR